MIYYIHTEKYSPKSYVVNFRTQISSSQSEERTMVFTREKWYVQSESRKMFFHVLENWYVQSEATEVCEFRAKIPAFSRPLALRCHVTNASFKQGVEILLMPKIDKGHKNYLKPEIWEETHLREIFCGTLIFQQSSMSCIDHHVGINWSETTLCLPLVKHLRVTLRCAVNINTSSFQHCPLKFNRARYNSRSTNNVQTEWGVDWSTFHLASHFDLSHSIILKMK